MKNKFKEFDNYLLVLFHELNFGDPEPTGDGRERLLKSWLQSEGREDKLHELIEDIVNNEKEKNAEKE